MKKPNSISEFTSERNALLISNFRKRLAEQSQISLEKAFMGAASTPAPRFWVSETRAAIVVTRILRGEESLEEMYEEKREMYKEIMRRFEVLREKHPEESISDLVWEVVNQPAPRSYMSWHRVKQIVYAEKKRVRQEKAELKRLQQQERRVP